MNVSGQLYQLIKSLTKSEKRYVKLQAGFNRSNSHLLQIFEAISKYAIEEDATLKARLKGASYLGHLDVLKVHLHKLILSVMRNFHKNSSKAAVLSDMLTDVQFLYNKGLYVACNKLLQKAKVLALNLNQDTAIIEIIEMERNLMGKLPSLPLKLKQINKFHEAENAALVRLQDETSLKLIANVSQLMIENYKQVASQSNFDKLLQFCKKAQATKRISSIPSSKIIYYTSIHNMLIALNDWDGTIQYGEMLIAAQIDQVSLKNEPPIDFIRLLRFQVNVCLKVNRVEKAQITFEILSQLASKFNKAQRRSKVLKSLLTEEILACSLLINSVNLSTDLH